MPSVSVTYDSKLTVVEPLVNNTASLSSGDNSVTHNNFNKSLNSTQAGTTEMVAAFELAMVDGAAAIDMRALTGTNGATVDGNGKKLRFAKIVAKAANANPVTIAPADSDGYDLFGSDGALTLSPGQEILLDLRTSAPTIGSSAKDIDVTGTGTQGINVIFVLGE